MFRIRESLCEMVSKTEKNASYFGVDFFFKKKHVLLTLLESQGVVLGKNVRLSVTFFRKGARSNPAANSIPPSH